MAIPLPRGLAHLAHSSLSTTERGGLERRPWDLGNEERKESCLLQAAGRIVQDLAWKVLKTGPGT